MRQLWSDRRSFPVASLPGVPLFAARSPRDKAAGRALFPGTPKRVRPLPYLTELSTTTLHLVPDDFVKGQSVWRDRSRFGNDATLASGTPVTVQSPSNLDKTARSYMPTSGVSWTVPEITWSLTTKRTYEFVLNSCDLNINRLLFGTNAANRFYFQTGTTTSIVSMGLIDSSAGGVWLGGVGLGTWSPSTSFIARLLHVTVDVEKLELKFYQNGVLSVTDTTTSGSWTPTAGSLTIGGATNSSTWFEFLRHEEVLSENTIKERAKRFNEVRGY